ncbi:MAG: hypothetical protein N2252_01215 [Candidatus Kryptonium sp.]|nr:hypothetical protein [Candidatus Kryptonium sp.]
MKRPYGIVILIFVIICTTNVFSYINLCVLPQDEASSNVIRDLVAYIEKDILLSRIVKIKRSGEGDYYIVYKPESGEIQIQSRMRKFEVVSSFFEMNARHNLPELVNDIILNRIGVPVKNTVVDGKNKFVSPFIFADNYLVKGKVQKLITDFKINYSSGEIELNENLQLIDTDSFIYPVNSFGSEIYGPFSCVVTSSIKVEYLSSTSRVFLKNTSAKTFYTYMFTNSELYGYISEELPGNSTRFIQLNWRSRKVYIAISEERINVENFEVFKIDLKTKVESGKTAIYSFRFPENKQFVNVNTISFESLEYDYLNKRVILKLRDSDFDKNLDEYLIIVNKTQEISSKQPVVSFSWLKPVKRLEIIKRRNDKETTFESSSILKDITNIPPGVLLEKYEVKNNEAVDFKLVDLDGDKVELTNFQSDFSGIQRSGDKIIFTRVSVGEHKLIFTLTDGKEKISKEVRINVVNTTPEIRDFEVLIDKENIIVNYNIIDPDPQNIENKISVKNINSQEIVIKTSLLTKDKVIFKMLPISGNFVVSIITTDGIAYATKENMVNYTPYYKLGEKGSSLMVLGPFGSEKALKVYKEKSAESGKVTLIYARSNLKSKPSSLWELLNSEEVLEIDMTNSDEFDIIPKKSGYYHFGFLSRNDSGEIYFKKLETILINEAPKITLTGAVVLGTQAILNFVISDPDNDDCKTDLFIRNIDTGETKSLILENENRFVSIYFDKAGVYDVELSASDFYGAQSKKEKIRLQVPSELPKFSKLSPNGISLSPSQLVTLKWELQETDYTLPVTYEIYVGESAQQLQLYASTNVPTTELKLKPGKTYYWKVIARFSKSLYTESALCKFFVENDYIVYSNSITFNSEIVKVVQDPSDLSKFYVILSNGNLVHIPKINASDYKVLGSLYSTAGEFVSSGRYLLNYSSNVFFVYDLTNFSLIRWSNIKDGIIFGAIYGDILVICTKTQLLLEDLKNQKSSTFSLPQFFSSALDIVPCFDEKRKMLIFPTSSYLLFIDLENQKVVRQEVVYSRGTVFYCDMIKDGIVLTLDIYGQINSYKLTEKSMQRISLHEIGISYPAKVLRLKNNGIIFSKTGKISVYRWDDSGTVKSVLNETKENLQYLLAPSENTMICLIKNRLEYYKYDSVSVLTLLQIKEISTNPIEIFGTESGIVLYDRSSVLFYIIHAN